MGHRLLIPINWLDDTFRNFRKTFVKARSVIGLVTVILPSQCHHTFPSHDYTLIINDPSTLMWRWRKKIKKNIQERVSRIKKVFLNSSWFHIFHKKDRSSLQKQTVFQQALQLFFYFILYTKVPPFNISSC